MRWRLRLSEFDFEIQYKKGLKNTQADALSRLKTFSETISPIDDEIPCFTTDPCVSLAEPADDEEPSTSDILDEYEFSDKLLLASEGIAEPALTPITHSEILLEQQRDALCTEIRSKMEQGDVNQRSFMVDDEGILLRTASGGHQIVVPTSLQPRVLRIAHYSKISGHPGGRRLYQYLRRNFYWPSMAVDCYAVSKNCVQCARNRVRLRQHQKELRLFPASSPLEFVAIDLLGELIKTPRGNRFLLVISDRFSKLVRTVPMKTITAEAVAKAFVTHWVMAYGPPVWLLSDNGKQFTSRFFQHVCRILGVENLFTTTYHPQTNGQVERYNRTLLSAIRTYVSDHPKDWDLFTDVITYSYNTQVHRVTSCTPFELVLSRPPSSLVLAPEPGGTIGEAPKSYLQRWKVWLHNLVSSARQSISKEQKRYQRNFNARVRPISQDLAPGSHVFVRKEHHGRDGHHKLSPVAEGPYRVVSLDKDTVVLRIGRSEERISRDRVVESPPPPYDILSEVVVPDPQQDTRQSDEPSMIEATHDVSQRAVSYTHLTLPTIA